MWGVAVSLKKKRSPSPSRSTAKASPGDARPPTPRRQEPSRVAIQVTPSSLLISAPGRVAEPYDQERFPRTETPQPSASQPTAWPGARSKALRLLGLRFAGSSTLLAGRVWAGGGRCDWRPVGPRVGAGIATSGGDGEPVQEMGPAQAVLAPGGSRSEPACPQLSSSRRGRSTTR